ncbi:thiol-disulfide oxidoreductase DCC family protein [Halogeometricum limi]|uniref:Predicted thiol-disulfide oxidoreductase YuxK, DCC family n=1 Tax=Halogeometricum limi TaxID=555875 RepID=A0A1I6IQP6_9EURY|nr:DCC1-like thiol-disulfide oxidoreductase family protein [Halogeometricum limi]SFR68949.1 Predicted thiol-disulfide oxidoreductase YuxK, DCC family [Halogeometricum limi]
MFVNYFADDARSSPVNLAVGRFVLGWWLVWKTVHYDWSLLFSGISRSMAYNGYDAILPVSAPWILTVEKWLLIALVLLVVVGYRIRFTALASAALATHLGTVRNTVTSSGEVSSLFIGSVFLVFVALYSDDDVLSVDGLRRVRSKSLDWLVARLKSDDDRSYRMPSMKYALLTLAILFFSTAASKVVDGGGLGFVAPSNLARLVLVRSYVYPWHDVQLVVVDYPLLGVLGGIGTLALEFGLLVAVLAGATVTPFVLGLVAFTLSNVVLLGIFFVDNLFFLTLFAAFDRAYARLAVDRDLDLVFDEHCLFCARSLYPVDLFDVEGSVTFYSQYDAPDGYEDRPGVDFGRAMYVFDGDDAHEGYDAFRELLRQNRLFHPLAWVMARRPVRAVGRRVYRYVADNRGRHFACRVENGG